MRNLSYLRIISYFFPFILCHSLCSQQVNITGRVRIFNSSKPLSAVFAKAEGVKNQQTETSNEGIFSLLLIEPEMGKRYKIKLTKAGYEVVNEESLFVVVGITDTLDVKMALSRDLADARQKLYNVFRTSMEMAYQEKIKTLNTQVMEEKKLKEKNGSRQKLLEAELANVIEQFAMANQQAQEMAKVLSYTSLNDDPEVFVSAFERFTKGEISIDSTCKRIEMGIKEVEGLMAKKEYSNQQTNFEKTIVKWGMVKAILYKSQLRFNDFDEEFQRILPYKSVENEQALSLLDYANFMGEWWKKYDTAIIYYRKAYAAKPSIETQLKILNEWGNAYYLKNDWEQARIKFEEARAIFTGDKANPADFPSSVAETYTNLGMLSFNEKQHALADSFFRLSETIYRQVQSRDSTLLVSEFARLLANQALNLKQMLVKDQPIADIEKRYLEAIYLYQKANKNGVISQFTRRLGQANDLLGSLYVADKNYKKADLYYKKALEIHTALASKNPIASFEIDLAKMTYNYGLNLNKLNDALNAKKNIWQAENMFRSRLNSDSTSVVGYLNACYRTLADFYLADSLVYDALSLNEKVYFSMKKTAYANPSVMGKNYSDVLLKLVHINGLIIKKEASNPLRQNIASRYIDTLLGEYLSYQKVYVQKRDSEVQNQKDRNNLMNTAYRDLAWAYFYNKNPKKAEESASIALDLKRDKSSLWCMLFSLLLQNEAKKEKEAKTIFQELSDGETGAKLAKTIASYIEEFEQLKCADTVKLQKKLKRWLPEAKDTAAK